MQIRALAVCAAALSHANKARSHLCSVLKRAALCRRLVYVRAAGPITITVLSIAISNIFKLYRGPHKIAVVGSIPQVLHSAPCAS